MKTNYVVGFLFDESFETVALIQKHKPAWQAGLLNGIGGKMEQGETPDETMEREFSEEAAYHGRLELTWKHFCSMSGANNDGTSFGIFFYFSVGNPYLAFSKESEPIGCFNVGAVCAGDWKTIGNVPWLVALARDFGKGVYPPSIVNVEYLPREEVVKS